MNDALHMLLGAALVMLGVLVTAIAERIRGLRVQRPAPKARELAAATFEAARATESVIVAQRDDIKTERVRGMRPPSAPPPTQHRADVIAALVGSGYRKQDATVAVDACVATERATLESWTRSALRRAGGAS